MAAHVKGGFESDPKTEPKEVRIVSDPLNRP